MDEELRQTISEAKEQQPVAVDLGWCQGAVQLGDIKQYIRANINSASRSFVAIGYYLKYIRDNELFTEDGYQSIWEFAKDEFGIGKSSASQFMSINDKFSKDGNSPVLLDEYRDFTSSKLAEMLTMTEEQLEQVNPTTTIVEIRQIKKPSKEDTILTSEQEPESSNNCIHRPEFMCTLPEASKLAQGDGVDCNAKCCWGCPEHKKCGYECNASVHRPADVKNETYDESYFVKWYFDKHPSDLEKLFEISKTTNVPGEIAKAFQMYRSRYGGLRGCCSEWSYSFHNFAGGIDLEVGNEKIHMKYGRFVKEALDIYDKPEMLDSIPEVMNNEPEIVDNEPEIVNDVDEEIIDEPSFEIVEADIIETEYEDDNNDEDEPEIINPEHYTYRDVDDELDKLMEYVENFREDNSIVPGRRKAKMRLDAIILLDKEMKLSVEDNKLEPEQPDLPILRNNEQRKEFIEAYVTWPIWIDQELTGEKYYRYDFDNGVSIVVKVYYCKIFDYTSVNLVYEERFRDDWGKEEYYLLEPDKYFKDCETNKSSLVDYLKEIQKKGA